MAARARGRIGHTDRLEQEATGGVTPNQPRSYIAKINSSQSIAVVGTYSDTVSSSITF